MKRRIIAGKETAERIQKIQRAGHEHDTDHQVDSENASKGLQRAAGLSCAYTLADNGRSAFLEAVLRHGGDAADVVGDSQRSHGQRAVDRTHGIDDDLAKGKGHLLCNDRNGEADHGNCGVPLKGDRSHGKAEHVVLLIHVSDSRGQ